MASKKGGGSTRNGRDSAGKRLGAKRTAGAYVSAGTILVRQRGTRAYPGEHVLLGSDHTLVAKITGILGVRYKRVGNNKKRCVYYIVPAAAPAA